MSNGIYQILCIYSFSISLTILKWTPIRDNETFLCTSLGYSIGKLPSETEGRYGNVMRSVQGCPLVICIVSFKIVSEGTEVNIVVNQVFTSYYVGVDKDY